MYWQVFEAELSRSASDCNGCFTRGRLGPLGWSWTTWLVSQGQLSVLVKRRPIGLDIQGTYTGGNGLHKSSWSTVFLTWQRCMRHAEPLKWTGLCHDFSCKPSSSLYSQTSADWLLLGRVVNGCFGYTTVSMGVSSVVECNAVQYLNKKGILLFVKIFPVLGCHCLGCSSKILQKYFTFPFGMCWLK